MAELYFSTNNFLIIILILQLEFFFFLAYTNVIMFNQTIANQKPVKFNQIGVAVDTNTVFYGFFFTLIFLKDLFLPNLL